MATDLVDLTLDDLSANPSAVGLFGGTPNHSAPTVATATSVTLVAANPVRKFLFIQNRTAADIAVNLSGTAITSLTPSALNPIIILPTNTSFQFDGNFVPTSAITVYQTSGGSVNTIIVVSL